jgi:hypothetical protein
MLAQPSAAAKTFDEKHKHKIKIPPRNNVTAAPPAAKNALFITATPKENLIPYHYTIKLGKISAGLAYLRNFILFCAQKGYLRNLAAH